MTRRELVKSVAAASGAFLVGCNEPASAPIEGTPRLQSRPLIATVHGSTGKQRFFTRRAEVVGFIPAGATWGTPLGLMLFLHGALRNVDTFVDAFQSAADESGVIVLAPFSEYQTWDGLIAGFGPDPIRIDEALRWTFERWNVDPLRIACTGFSDGGTYSLAIGRANGDLFPRIAAFSPGFLIPVEEVGKPRILVTHGDEDLVLPVTTTREIIVPDLRYLGYEVDYREFSGPHAVPLETARAFIESLGTS